MVSGADTAAPGWRAIRAFLRSVARLVLWTGVLIGGLSVFLAWAPRIGAALNHVSRGESIQIYVALVVMAFVLLALVTMLSRKGPISWAALHAGLLAAMAAAIYWLPGWSGTLAASSFVLLIVIPTMLARRATRQLPAGYRRGAALSMWLASRLHPSRPWRFAADFFAAQALGTIAAEIAAYEALTPNATPEQAAMLGQWTAIARDDWASVLVQVRSAGPAPVLEIRALGELGRTDEMIAAYRRLPRRFERMGLLHCALWVLAFGGRRDGVEALLRGRLRSTVAEHKAYWSFVATQAAGADDAEQRRLLAQHAGASEDETFRRAAARHLAGPARREPIALSPAAFATIASIEKTWLR